MKLAPPSIELSDNAVKALAIAMRDVARADGEHPREMQLIQEFARGLELGEDPADLSTIAGPTEAELFLKSLVLVALADGVVTEGEGQVIRDYADRLGFGEPEVARCTTDVAAGMLSELQGVTHFREQVIEIGERMGLDRFTILHALEGEA
ncbi:MAG: TerB family tellurite resistance protein [Deltaproteobacteria bacterium]|nr:MAG: TerB family tellurite resistance protein [Deltaproteobacteria bacterium]